MTKIREPWILELFRFLDTVDYPCQDELFIGPHTYDDLLEKHVEEFLAVEVNCNDLFAWAFADSEFIQSLEDVELLRSAYGDVEEALPEDLRDKKMHWYQMLYAARKRGMRIQHAWYDKGSLPKELHELFNNVGEVRETSIINPRFEEESAADET